jgi:conjugal transfer pilus assembly protein TraK
MHRAAIVAAVLMIPILTYGATSSKNEKHETIVAQTETVGSEGEFPTVVLPEVTTNVRLSSSDMNRIACPSDVKEALTSTEKGMSIKITGKDAFVKFKVIKKPDGKFTYLTTPTEIYVVCGDETFSMIGFPQRVPSQTIRLSSGKGTKIKENLSIYSGLPFEKKILKAIREVYTESIPDSYSISRPEKQIRSFKEISLSLKRIVDIEGEGLRIKELEATLKSTIPFKISEKMFLRSEVAENPIAISLEQHVLRPGEPARVFIVEQRSERPNGRGLGGDLPVMSGASKIIDKQSAVESKSVAQEDAHER